jgi:isoleucyl-tRNA synthetase
LLRSLALCVLLSCACCVLLRACGARRRWGLRFVGASVSDKVDFAAEEHRVLSYWNDISAFETSLKHSEGKPIYTFYDGPPFATGLPHYGHILAGTIKDVVTRYAHQTGHHVVRRFGWDWSDD